MEWKKGTRGKAVTIRCLLDGLLLQACVGTGRIVAWDGDEAFGLEALEAAYYEVVEATEDEWLMVERASYRLLRKARDFRWMMRA